MTSQQDYNDLISELKHQFNEITMKISKLNILYMMIIVNNYRKNLERELIKQQGIRKHMDKVFSDMWENRYE